MNIQTIPATSETAFIHELKKRYEADGYDVATEPALHLPGALAVVRADLVAKRGEEAIVVEVRRSGEPRGIDYWRQALQAVESKPGWKYVVVVPGEGEAGLEDVDLSPNKIDHLLVESEELLASHHNNAALLTSWIAFELALKSAAKRLGISTQVPSLSTLLAAVYDEGELDPDDYIRLRTAMDLRNRVAHGFVTDPVPNDEVNVVVSSTKDLLLAA